MAISTINLSKAVSGALPDANAPSGSVLQVVSGTTSSPVSTSSTSFQASNLTVSITPTSASNKIFIIASGNGYASSNESIIYTLYRNSTELSGNGSGFTTHWISGQRGVFPYTMHYLDSPSTTSSITYKVYFKSSSGAAVNTPDGSTNVITVMEIAA